MWESIKKWLIGAGRWLARFSKTVAAKFLEEYGDVAMECVKKAALHPGSGEDKFKYAVACFLTKVPGASLYLVQTAIQVAYAMYKEDQGEE